MPIRVGITLSFAVLLLSTSVELSAQSQPAAAQCGDEALAAAKSALRSDNTKKAIDILNRASKKCPADHRLLVEQGRAYLYSKKDARAIALFQEVLRRDSSNRVAKLELARGLGYRQRFSESDELYKQLLQSNPQDEVASLGLVRNLVHERKRSEARVKVNEALLLHPNSLKLQQYRNGLNQDPPKLNSIVHSEGIPVRGKVQDWTAFLSDSSGHQMLYSLQRVNYQLNSTLSTRVDTWANVICGLRAAT